MTGAPVPAGRTVLVVDAANVVGSVPDGWWRDRPGAARRLHDRLVAGTLEHDEVVLVLEGQARRGQPAGLVQGVGPPVRTVHASGEGDDVIVDEVAGRVGDAEVVVVTADRGLRVRVGAVGARCEGPRWLLDQLPPAYAG